MATRLQLQIAYIEANRCANIKVVIVNHLHEIYWNGFKHLFCSHHFIASSAPKESRRNSKQRNRRMNQFELQMRNLQFHSILSVYSICSMFSVRFWLNVPDKKYYEIVSSQLMHFNVKSRFGVCYLRICGILYCILCDIDSIVSSIYSLVVAICYPECSQTAFSID